MKYRIEGIGQQVPKSGYTIETDSARDAIGKYDAVKKLFGNARAIDNNGVVSLIELYVRADAEK